MHIAHLQAGMSPEDGGPTRSLSNYARSQASAGHRVSIWTLDGLPNTSPPVAVPPPIEMHAYRVEAPVRLRRSSLLHQALRRADTPDIYHLHGAWARAVYYGAIEAKRRNRPYLVEIMGMYEPWSLGQRALTKRVARWWYQDNVLHDAACIHVNSQQEAEHVRELGFRRPIAVIPAGVDMEEFAEQVATLPHQAPWPELQDQHYVLYLSRIHPKKRLALLIRCWAKLCSDFPGWQLAIAGTGEPSYVDECHQIAAEAGISSRCFWAGHVTEPQKHWLYRNAHCYVLPTFSENFGNTITESLIHRTPVITTTETPWSDLVTHRCGWHVPSTEADICQALQEALHLSPSAHQAMGLAGEALVRDQYSLDSVCRTLETVYGWLAGGGDRPSCVTI